MKNTQIFLSGLSKEQKEFLNLLNLTAKVHGEVKLKTGNAEVPVWDEKFFHLEGSDLWKGFGPEDQRNMLLALGEKILQEAYFIENAGMAYAAKMNLGARSKEERQFYCFVAEEETKHLRMLEELTHFNKSLETIPSFALLIGEIIQDATALSHLLLIQILLEGWGLNYYKSLAKEAQDENVSAVFKMILKDELRHHSAGIILFSAYGNMKEEEVGQFLSYLERLAFMVKIGPYTVCEALFSKIEKPSREQLEKFLVETDAVKITSEKMKLIGQLISKNLRKEILEVINDQKILAPMNLEEMTNVLYEAMPGIFQRG